MNLDLGLSESEEIIKSTALDFLKRDVPKNIVQHLLDTETCFNSEIWQKMADIGWLGIIIPEEYGGSGNTLFSAGILFESLGTAPLPGPHFSSSILSSLIIQKTAREEQKKKILPGIAKGDKIFTLAMNEPNGGWEPLNIQMVTEKSGDCFLLNGTKLFVHDAKAATHFIVVARTKDNKVKRGIVLLVVDSTADGIEIKRLPGFLSNSLFEVNFHFVKVPEENLLGEGEDGDNWSPLYESILYATPVLCAYKVGACQSVVNQTLEYSRIRIQFGQKIGIFQRVQDWIIDMVNFTDAARWTTYEALWKLDNKTQFDKDIQLSVHLAKAVASESYFEIVTLAHRVFSGISYSKEHPVSFHTRMSRSLFDYLGDPEFHKQKIAGLLVN